MSRLINRFLEALHYNPVLKFFYRIPLAPWLYNFCLALLGAIFYGFPSRRLFVIGITGTNGKTTTTELLGYVLKKAGKKVAIISSLGVEIAGQCTDKPLDNTMPGRFFLQQFFKDSTDQGCKYAVVEVTSQGIALNRHRFINWSAAVFTNLSPEHIEAHGSFEKYRAAKLKFFSYVARGGGQVFINKDDANAKYFIDAAKEAQTNLFSLVDWPSKLIGDFNKYNIGAVAIVADSLGIEEKIVQEAVAEFGGVLGRMEVIQQKPFKVVIDYAVTPDALEAVYKTLKKETEGEMICVLGACGGGRDEWKRVELGKITNQYCDHIILTNEDPYDEDPQKILLDIKSGVPRATIILDRKKAIKKAISLAKQGDAVITTGKGSEKWIHIANEQKIPWSEKEVILEALRSR